MNSNRAVRIHDSKSVLSIGVALLGGLAVPLQCCLVVLGNAFAPDIHQPKVCLSFGVALLGVNAEPSHRCGIVAASIRCRGFVKCLLRRDRCAGQHSQ